MHQRNMNGANVQPAQRNVWNSVQKVNEMLVEILDFLKSLVLGLRTSDVIFMKTEYYFETQRIPFHQFHEDLSSLEKQNFGTQKCIMFLVLNRRSFKVKGL